MTADARAGGPAASAYAAGRDARRAGRNPEAHERFCEALRLARKHGDRGIEAGALCALADVVFHFNPDPERDCFTLRERYGRQAAALFHDLGEEVGESYALQILASVAPPPEARSMLEDSLRLARQAGDRRCEATALERLGARLALGPERERSRELRRQALSLFREVGDPRGAANALFGLSLVVDDDDETRACLREAAALYREAGAAESAAQMLQMLAHEAYEPDPERRETLLREALGLYRQAGSPVASASCLRLLADVVRTRGDEGLAASFEAQADALCPKPEPAPELQAAFESGDEETIRQAVRAAFGGGAGAP